MKEGIELTHTPNPDAQAEEVNEEKVIEVLGKLNIKKLTTWQPGTPILYVLPDYMRNDKGTFGNIPRNVRPTIARVELPHDISLLEKPEEVLSGVLHNTPGGRIDYYAVDGSGNITYMQLPKDRSGRQPEYVVRRSNLFEANDPYFPPSKSPR